MALPVFDYLAPKSIEEACAALQSKPDTSKLIAGGQSVLRVMKFRIMAPELLVDVKAIPGLRYVEEEPDVLRIGATATQTDVLRSEIVRTEFPLLFEAISRIATTAVRNTATIVGNICVGHTASDPSAALLALDAILVVVGTTGERVVPISEFFVGHMTTSLDATELVREIRIPRRKGNLGMAYLAHAGRAAMETPLVAAGAILSVRDGVCTGATIALAGADETPIRVGRAEEALVGTRIDDRTILQASSIAAEDCSPDTDVYASGEYRRRLVAVYVRDALRTAASRVQ
ncbi:carbon-monoxide dehydrogenase medium subunit [Rhizobium leguminosarum]|uniref:Carbon-monoxide dehydrogenase medium subunit n=1 Tax=Rhizobium leguminosarum TaxID=384 RepID=A0AAE2T0Q8_RHILE|nr:MULTISPECIES: xanthine dehydrogenase family protein subunit M [Rhizobium]ARM90988.1 carbon monoxide dehydrogenase middle subunit CoxM/CutM-like protein [Rhizobium sp. CIAT894]MBB4293848.1 carbon-monoxide dehydrogenase medium subunit [Rhizobium leguminosarum]MBB4299581.1 carbon-monoxide dehydrogenase medium subunit [Rhizobium leguminosarum]MBB4311018.1 carbon-monoxide dehydrogenase medium subunit [Rhizobium leguminosarum]MBB4420133.1 carbon-monoxide dehydrogenase medium subunit [Rhizobium le